MDTMEKGKTIILADNLSFAYDHKYSALEHLSFHYVLQHLTLVEECLY